jgi:hypothetical protein
VKDKTVAALDQLLDTGRNVGNFTDNLGRAAHYIARREQGFTPLAAGQSVKKWFFDYGDLTQTEEQVLRRVVPFYADPRLSPGGLPPDAGVALRLLHGSSNRAASMRNRCGRPIYFGWRL